MDTHSKSFDLAFLGRVRNATILLGIFGSLFVFSFVGTQSGLGWCAGAAVSLVNFVLLQWILTRIFRPQPMLGPIVALAFLVKIPLLLVSVWLSVGVFGLPVLWFSLGFFLLFAVIILKTLGRLLVQRSGLQVSDPRNGAAFRMGTRGASGDNDSGDKGTPSPGSRLDSNGDSTKSGLGKASLKAPGLKTSLGALLLFFLLGLGWPLLPTLTAERPDSQWTTTIDLETVHGVALAQTGHDDHSHDGDDHSHDDHSGHDHDAAHGGDAHGDHGDGHGDHGAHDDHGPVKHFPHLLNYVEWVLEKVGAPTSWMAPIFKYENAFFSILVGLLLGGAAAVASSRREMIPGRLQAAVELAVETFYNFIRGILGEHTRTYLPFLGTLFFYIWGMNWLGLIPGGKSPTAYLNTTLTLAVIVFLVVQITGLIRLGPGGWLHHLAGSPKDPVGWALVPLMLPLELVGEIAKPVSLSLRLFGNIMGEDTLLALFAVLLTISVPALGAVGVPLHVPFIFLALLASSIQALVFTLLATIYISQMLPHGHEEEH